MSDEIRLRSDTAANWAARNPVLGPSEPGYERNTRILRIGDGVTAWLDLPTIDMGAHTLDELGDVDLSTAAPNPGDALLYDPVTDLWLPGSPYGPGGSGAMKWRGGWLAAPTVPTTMDFESQTLPDGYAYSAPPSFPARTDPVTGTTIAMRPPTIGGGGYAWVEWPIAFGGGGDITIRYWVESESGYDIARFYVDNVQLAADSGAPGVWRTATLSGVAPGVRMLRIGYTKDGSGSWGFDGVDVGRIGFPTPDPSAAYMLGHVVTYNGGTWVSNIDTNSSTPGANGDWTAI